MENKNQLWEQIRTDTMVYSSKRSKESPEYYEYLKTKGEWESIVKKRTNGILLRSKAQWIEGGEKIQNIS